MTWVFGYGSLIWRPAFEFEERHPAYLTGYVRRFWQKSTDHRGVPEQPGRVVTLMREPGVRCWGMAYRVAEDVWAKVRAGLDHRERGGYTHRLLPVHDREDRVLTEALVYIAHAGNPNFHGPESLETLADTIAHCQGPSGPNPEYVLELERALRDMDAHDAHVSTLAALLRRRGALVDR